MLTKSSNKYNNSTVNIATSTPQHKALLNSNRTSPGWFSQQTRVWPWSLRTNRTTQQKQKHYYRTPTPTKCSPRTSLPISKTNLLPFLKTSNKQEAFPPKNTNNSTPLVQSLTSSMGSPKYIKQAPP